MSPLKAHRSYRRRAKATCPAYLARSYLPGPLISDVATPYRGWEVHLTRGWRRRRRQAECRSERNLLRAPCGKGLQIFCWVFVHTVRNTDHTMLGILCRSTYRVVLRVECQNALPSQFASFAIWKMVQQHTQHSKGYAQTRWLYIYGGNFMLRKTVRAYVNQWNYD